MKSSKDTPRSLNREEQETLIKEEIQRFLKLAKDKGSLTVEEINENLAPEIVDSTVLDTFMHACT